MSLPFLLLPSQGSYSVRYFVPGPCPVVPDKLPLSFRTYKRLYTNQRQRTRGSRTTYSEVVVNRGTKGNDRGEDNETRVSSLETCPNGVGRVMYGGSLGSFWVPKSIHGRCHLVDVTTFMKYRGTGHVVGPRYTIGNSMTYILITLTPRLKI